MGQASKDNDFASIEVHNLEDFRNQLGIPQVIYFRNLGSMKHAQKPHRHSFYVLLHIESGHGHHIIDSEAYPIKADTPMISLLSPCQLHFWDLDDKLRGTAIRFSDELFYSLQPKDTTHTAHELIEIIDCPFLYITDAKTQVRIRNIINIMKQECHGAKMGRDIIFIAYLNILLVLMGRICQQQIKSFNCINSHHYYPSLVNSFRSCVSCNFIEHRNISWYAKKLGVSEGHLYDVIKKETGSSPGWIIRREIVSEAKRLLAHTELTIAEISYKLNFDDPSYFSRIMKREIGMNPSHFRNVVRERYNMVTKK